MKTKETTLDKIRTRPRFKIFTNLSPEEYESRLKEYLKENHQNFNGSINREVATIWVKKNEDRYWKPYLSLRTEKEENITAVRGVFGPSSSVWTFFMFLYFGFSILWMVFITLWFVEHQINSSDFPWALSASFITLGLLLLSYLASRYGQIKAKEEMQALRRFAEESTLKFEKKES